MYVYVCIYIHIHIYLYICTCMYIFTYSMYTTKKTVHSLYGLHSAWPLSAQSFKPLLSSPRRRQVLAGGASGHTAGVAGVAE